MGLFQKLVEAEPRFREELEPLGYTEKRIEWQLELSPLRRGQRIRLTGPFVRRESRYKALPDRQRSGKVTGENAKPFLCADTNEFIFEGDCGSPQRSKFLSLHRDLLGFCRACASASNAQCAKSQIEAREIIEELIPALRRLIGLLSLNPGALRARLPAQWDPKPKALIALATASRLLGDYKIVQRFWKQRLGDLHTTVTGVCGVSGMNASDGGSSEPHIGNLLETFPVPLRLFGQTPAMSSINCDSFRSAGKLQLANSPICSRCGMTATAVLSHLLKRESDSGDEASFRKSGLHSVVLAEDTAKGGRSRPLANQMAVFWTKDEVTMQLTPESKEPVEELVSLSLAEDSAIEGETESGLIPESRPGQVRRFLESPWYCRGREVEEFNSTGFYFAILSPNKARLVLREWIESDISAIRKNLLTYRSALAIISREQREPVTPALRQVLEALRAPAAKQRPHDEKPRLAEVEPELTRQLIRTMFQGAKPPAALLARAVHAATSTAPQTVLGSLLKSANTAHLPKLRKDGGGDFVTLRDGKTVRLSNLLSDAVGALDEACGPLRQHTPKQQAEFALGFHHQQAALQHPQKSKSA